MTKKTRLGWVVAVLVLGLILILWGAKALVTISSPPAKDAATAKDSAAIVSATTHDASESEAAPTSEKPASSTSATLVQTALAENRSLVRELTAVGSLQAKDAVDLRAEITGQITALNFTEGQSVQKGQLLVQLDDRTAKANLQEAKARLQLAQSQHKRSRQLQQEGFISSQAQDESASQLAVAQASVQAAEAQLAKTRVIAPFEGLVGLKKLSVGEYVSPGTELLSLVSVDPLEVDFRVPEHYLSKVKLDSPVELRIDAFPDQSYTAKVGAINPQVDAAGRSLWLRAQVANPDRSLRPGLFARIRLNLAEDQAIMVPETALAPSGGNQYVYQVVNHVAQRVPVTVGQRRDAWVEVLGIEAGDEVIVSGLQKVSEGTMVRTQEP